MIEINNNSELKFSLDVSGHPGPIDEIRLVVDKVYYPGILEDGIVTVQLHNLYELFKAGEYDYSLEIIIGNQYFKPIKDKIILKENIKVESKILTTETKENNIKVERIEPEIKTESLPIDSISQQHKETKLSKFLTEDIQT